MVTGCKGVRALAASLNSNLFLSLFRHPHQVAAVSWFQGVRGGELASTRTNSRGGRIQSALTRRHGLQLPAQLSFDSWKQIGNQLSAIADASAWWLGDWLVFGQTRYPERYRQAIDETALDYQTLRNYAWVTRRFPVSRRRDTLSMQHHAEVASLPCELQDEWLDRAERFQWSRNQLRQYVRINRETSADEQPEAEGPGAAAPRLPEPKATVTVQLSIGSLREARWQNAARKMCRSLDEWIVTVLNQAADAILLADHEIAGPFEELVIEVDPGRRMSADSA